MEKEVQKPFVFNVEDVMTFAVLASALHELDQGKMLELSRMLWPWMEGDEKYLKKRMQYIANATARTAAVLKEALRPQIQEIIIEQNKKKKPQN